MVLPEAGGTPPEGFTSDNPYPSDNDPYASSSSSPSSSPVQRRRDGLRHFQYDSSAFPQPIPFLGPVIGYSDRLIRWRIDDTLTLAERAMRRPLSPDEAQAMAYHLYDAESKRSYCTAAGLGVGIWRWKATTPVNGYPMWTPKPESVNPDKFSFLRGQYAQTARSSFRFGVWCTFAMFMGSLIGGTFTSPAAAKAAAEDPRLADLKTALKTSEQDRQRRMRGEHERRAAAGGQGPAGSGESSLPPHAGAPRWGRSPPPPVSTPAAAEDDMSPTSGNEPWSSSGYQSGSSFASSSETQQQRYQSRQPTQRVHDDDASPTGGLFQDDTQNQSNESAWERLRRGGGPPSQTSAFGGRRQGESTTEDSWAFPKEDDSSNEKRW